MQRAATDEVIDLIASIEMHRQELERRLADYRKNPEAGVPWEEVRARLAKLVG